MKRKLAVLLLAVMTLSMVACGKQDDASTDTSSDAAVEDSVEVEPEKVAENALEILNTVWGSYAEEDKFPVGGGDSANLNFEGPGAFDATNAEEMDVTLGLPQAQAGLVDDAASMMNAMMANNFTAGVFHVADAANVQTVADALKDGIMNKQWMCGMPEKMIVVSVGDYVVSAYGLEAAIDPFKTKIQEAYPTATVLYEESITE